MLAAVLVVVVVLVVVGCNVGVLLIRMLVEHRIVVCWYEPQLFVVVAPLMVGWMLKMTLLVHVLEVGGLLYTYAAVLEV